MLKLSTKGHYGLRLMLDLAFNFESGPVSLKAISQRQEISEKYLWQLIQPLRNSGLVTSVRGSAGGYLLSKPLSEITLKDILVALEGPVCLAEHPQKCACRQLWQEMTESIGKMFDSFTLEQMMHKSRQEDARKIQICPL